MDMSTSSLNLFATDPKTLGHSSKNLFFTPISTPYNSSENLFFTPISTPSSSLENLSPSSDLHHPFFTVFGFHQKLDPKIKSLMICAAVLEIIPILGAFFTLISSSLKAFGNSNKLEQNLQDTSYIPIFYVRIGLSLLGLGLICLLIDLICTLIVYITNSIMK